MPRAALVAVAWKVRRSLLLAQPGKEPLKPRIGEDFFHCVDLVAKLIVGPGLVDEVFAGLAGGHRFLSSFAPRNDVVLPRLDCCPEAEGAFVLQLRQLCAHVASLTFVFCCSRFFNA